ncbi:TPA: hypothetical protein N0F65_010014 [Lagenidium giganteum]|uniref:C2H2-type domain-containing protein n=1 Tax=Lagenidium giganteum TaxID=4803 RepID=A0AAV2ZBP7_9STRA|nr:TPA: hypothetical protein N0F65_010014 [Lagenidium giganteum]
MQQLGRTERAVEESQHAVDMSKRIMRGMTWSGWIYNKLSAPPQPNGDPNDQVGAPHGMQIAMGFICPDCKVVFKTPDELATHYTKTHENTRPNHQNGKSPGSASSGIDSSTIIDAEVTDINDVTAYSPIF